MTEETRKYLQRIASKGGSRSTPAKSAANSENGKKGGWPKGKPRKSIPLDERSKKVAELKAQGKIKEVDKAFGVHLKQVVEDFVARATPEDVKALLKKAGANDHCQPDEYSQEHPNYEHE